MILTPITDEVKAKVRALAAQEPQPTQREIARQAGCSATAVGRIFAAEGLLRRVAPTASRGVSSDARSCCFIFTGKAAPKPGAVDYVAEQARRIREAWSKQHGK